MADNIRTRYVYKKNEIKFEIDDYKITIKHDKQQVKVPEKPKEKASEEFEPNYTNPFRKPDYAHSEDSVDDNSSSMSE